ncbi:hypothetical protein OF83DRAFT_1063505 [Amylostereum chailletii]|nr:hypothetical protein OF83DRAFT_1063505 [Amylostereum chailletii]
MSFAFEEDVEDLFFRSMGSPSMGNVQVKELVGRGREVRVDVQVTFSQDGPIDQASICRLRTKQNSKAEGVGIFVRLLWQLPERRDGHTIAVDMTIYLPANSNSQRNFAALAIVMPMYTISLDNLARHFMFERVSLWTSNNAVEAKNLHAHNISVITSNHRISGVFKVTRALELQSKNGLIAVDVDALNAANGIPTTLNIETKNAPLTAKLSLTSTSTSHTGGIFQINAHTSNKPLSVTHAVSPPDSVLDLHASTTNAPALVQLDGAYEGGFAVRTTNAKPALAKNAASDPMGKGRRRVERVFQRAGVVQGAVAWVGEGEEWEDKDRKGEVAVESTNAPATLVL